MNTNASKNRRIGIVLQYSQMAISIIINLIYTPIMIRVLGDAEYGIYSIAASIISYLNIISLGFGASYIRFYSRYKAKEEQDNIARLNGLFIIVFLMMSVVSIFCGLIITNYSGYFFNESYSSEEVEIAKILMLFLTFNMAISFPISIFSSYIVSHEKFIFLKIISIISTVFSPLLSIAFLYLGFGSIGMVAVTTSMSIVVGVLNAFFCFSKLKMQFKFGKIDFLLLKEIFIFSIFIAINQIIDQINWQTDKVILGKMINATAVAIYTVAATINTMYINFSTAVSNVFVPQIHFIMNNDSIDEGKKNNELTNIFIKVGRIQLFILGLVLSGFIFFGKYFVCKWAGEQYIDAYYIALLLICPVTISLCQNIGIEIQRAKNKHQFRSIVYLIMAILNIGISVLFTHFWGYIGVAIGTTISLILANGLVMNIYYHRVIKINIILFWKEILLILLKLIPVFAVGAAAMIFVPCYNTMIWIILIILYSFVYCIYAGLLVTNKYEKTMLSSVFKHVFGRRREL
jgi:O-antigen/teichoic acid export membrane protein